MTDAITTILSIIDAAGPSDDAAALITESTSAAATTPARAARKRNQSSDGVAGRHVDTSSPPENAPPPAEPSRAGAAPPSQQDNRKSDATLAGNSPQDAQPSSGGGNIDREEPLDSALAWCADNCGENDVDNGKRLRRYFGRDLMVIAQAGEAIGAWLCWSGRHWDIDGGEAGVHLVAQRVGDLILQEADFITSTAFERELIDAGELARTHVENRESELLEIDSKDKSESAKARRAGLKAEIKELMGIVKRGASAWSALISRKISRREFSNQSKNMARIRNMLDAAGPHVRQPPDAFNADQMLVATLTHTLRFERVPDPECPDPDAVRYTAGLAAEEAHRRSDMLTAMVPVAYAPSAKGPRWEKFLDRCIPATGKRRTLQAFTGLGLLGLPVQRLMFHYGTGANGKSVFLEVITRLLGGSFAVGLPVESVTGMAMGTGAQASPDIARLFGKRMLRVHELPQGVQLRAEVIKKLTGGEKMVARALHEGFFEFQPIAKPHMSGNDFPGFDGSDGGMRRRILLMHWDVTIPETERRDFEEYVTELLAEGPAILNWLIAGAMDYLSEGLVVDGEVLADTERYADEMDPIGQFVKHCIWCAVNGDRPDQYDGNNEKARDVFLAYKAWSEANAKRVMSETRFGKILKKKIPFDDTKRIRVYLNVRLHDVPEAVDDNGRPVNRGHSAPPSSGDEPTF